MTTIGLNYKEQLQQTFDEFEACTRKLCSLGARSFGAFTFTVGRLPLQSLNIAMHASSRRQQAIKRLSRFCVGALGNERSG